MLHINDLSFAVAGRPLFDHATVAVHQGERVGLIGRNGTGKTTLLRLISGELSGGEDSVTVPRRARVGKVSQDPPGGPQAIIDTVLEADRERTVLLAEAESSHDSTRLAEVHDRLLQIQADSAPARAARILAGLGFDEAAQQRPCSELSGGWRMRVALAALLFSQPDLLLLDEPTNHLDLEATLWLESYLKTYPGTLLLVSHDRELLNRIPQRIVNIEDGKLVAYGGNYDEFQRLRRERLALQEAQRAKQEEQRRHIQGFVDRFRYKASKARQAQSRLKALARMEPIAAAGQERSIAFDFPMPSPLAPPILTLRDVAVGYQPELPVLSGLDLRLDMDDRIALLGPNGNGKSTLMRLLANRLPPQSGDMDRSGKLTVGYFSQDQADELDLAVSALQLLGRVMPGSPPRTLRGYLGRFGFGADKVETPIAQLSGGEKARLLFALICRDSPHLLLLDEPTNHLDVDSREALVQAVNEFEGAVVLVSHDPHLVELVADRLWLVQDNRVRPFEGDLEDYRRLVLEQRRAGRRPLREPAEAEVKPAAKPESKKEKRRNAAEARATLAEARARVRRSESEMEALGRRKRALEQKLADPNTYAVADGDPGALQIELGSVKQALAAAETDWLEAQAALEKG